MPLDAPTILAMIVITNVAMTAAVLAVASGQRIPGLRSLAAALVPNTAIYLLYGLHGHIPDLLSIALPNTLGALVATLVLRAVLQLVGAQVRWPALLVIPALVLTASLLLMDNRPARIVTVNTLLAFQQAWVLRALTRGGVPLAGRGRHLIFTSAAALLAMFGFRTLSVAAGWAPAPLVTANTAFNTLTYLATYLAVVFLTFGFVLAAMEQLADQNRRLALMDSLTGLPNRRAALDYLDRLWASARRTGAPLTLLMLDVDRFKGINDRHGHPAGDEVLRRVAETIRQRLRNQDMACRYGGEEFLILLPDTTPDGGRVLAETLRTAIETLSITDDADRPIAVTASFGLCGGTPDGHPDPASLIGRADAALYRAKEGGRNRVAEG